MFWFLCEVDKFINFIIIVLIVVILFRLKCICNKDRYLMRVFKEYGF